MYACSYGLLCTNERTLRRPSPAGSMYAICKYLVPRWLLTNTTRRSGGDGERVHYEQTIDADDGSVVSHAGAVFR